jgi:hypothetical protein
MLDVLTFGLERNNQGTESANGLRLYFAKTSGRTGWQLKLDTWNGIPGLSIFSQE